MGTAAPVSEADTFANVTALREAITALGYQTEDMSEIGMPQFVAFGFFTGAERTTLWVGQDAAIGEPGDHRFTIWQTPYVSLEQIIDGNDEGRWVRHSLVDPDRDSLMAVAALAGTPAIPLTHAEATDSIQAACRMRHEPPVTDDPIVAPGEKHTCYSCDMRLG